MGEGTYSGSLPGGMTMFIASDMRLYFIILSLAVVLDNDGDALTCCRNINTFELEVK